MLIRQRILLRLLDLLGGSASHLQAVKLSFLVSTETASKGGDAFYQFLPYRHGPFSFGMYQESNAMVRHGLIQDENNAWTLTAAGRNKAQTLSEDVDFELESLVEHYASFPVNDLIDYVYSEYPWYTLKSTRESATRPVRAKKAVYTVGYQGLLIDGFLNLLLSHGVNHLADVRSNPVSRRYGFHKSTLDRLCSKLDIRYSHYPDLGITSEKRHGLESDSDYQILFEDYDDRMSRETSADFERLCGAICSTPTALMCAEEDPKLCHRSILAKYCSEATSLETVELRD